MIPTRFLLRIPIPHYTASPSMVAFFTIPQKTYKNKKKLKSEIEAKAFVKSTSSNSITTLAPIIATSNMQAY